MCVDVCMCICISLYLSEVDVIRASGKMVKCDTSRPFFLISVMCCCS